MSDKQLTMHSLPEFIKELQVELADNPVLFVSVKSASIGKWGMARLWRSWMTATAEYMTASGATMPLCIDTNGINFGSRPFNGNDAHDLFTSKWMGTDENGNRLSWAKSKNGDKRAADKGERFFAMKKHEDWCSERGIILINPIGSEYEQMAKEHG